MLIIFEFATSEETLSFKLPPNIAHPPTTIGACVEPDASTTMSPEMVKLPLIDTLELPERTSEDPGAIITGPKITTQKKVTRESNQSVMDVVRRSESVNNKLAEIFKL